MASRAGGNADDLVSSQLSLSSSQLRPLCATLSLT